MLTLIESISLAGDRAKQNDDACGYLGVRAWVIDGATDLHDAPLTGWATDASWLAHMSNAQFHGFEAQDLRETIRTVSAVAAQAFENARQERAFERWQSPIASVLMIEETSSGVDGVDLGDCRIFSLDADGAVQAAGDTPGRSEAESQLASQQQDADRPLLRRTATIERLRMLRAGINRPGAEWTFGLDPTCADHARSWALALKRPAHLLLMTDGFSAMVDRYRGYDAASFMRAALNLGLQELGRELRAIESADAGGALHPRFKRSDDATALLLRLE